MPKNASTLSKPSASKSAAHEVDELIRRGRRQGHLSLPELRTAFEQAGVAPTRARSILRELSDDGVKLSEQPGDDPAREPAVADHPEVEHADVTHAKTELAEAQFGELDETELDDAAEIDDGDLNALLAQDSDDDESTDDDGAQDEPEAGPATLTNARTARKAPSAQAAPAAAAEPVATADDDGGEIDLDDQTSVMGDSVHTYLKSIGRTSLLTAEQEVDLAKRIEAGLFAEHKLESETGLSADYRAGLEAVAEDGRRAKAHMLEANLRLVVSVAKKYSDRGLSLLDVVQEGNLGLIRAVEKFDYTKGYKFSTYAMWWIRQAIQRGFADSARTIRLPVHVLEMLSKLSRVERDMHQRLGREPTPEELAVELDRTPDQIEELLRTSRQPISLDSTIGEDGETSIGDLIEDVDAPEASELVDRQLMAEQLRHALDALTPREATIMAMRFGLYDGNPHTLDEIGKALGLTRERIRQLEKQSLSKLRHPSRAQPLLEYAV
ncbi:MAG TPA: RNA polymerase sigma factor [Streptosporangiaceae bacterium]|jgi:RNA polymerase primary sigma factor|nr:RNA polymerase sigma factor [Streptosporangiaceae bacterium]